MTRLIGTAQDDVINGTTETDLICGLRGDDSLKGLQGEDVLNGGQGHDLITHPVPDLLQFSRQYIAYSEGKVPYKERPETVKTRIHAVLSPLPNNP